jgi:hypothetical protein
MCYRSSDNVFLKNLSVNFITKIRIKLHKNLPFTRKPPKDTKIWHYMDFSKYISLLENKKLYFSVIEKLEDKLEGVPTKADSEGQKSFCSYWETIGKEWADTYIDIQISAAKDRRLLKKLVYVKCLRMDEHESPWAWKEYVKSGKGVAIQTTYGQLIESFKDCKQTVNVEVIDYSEDTAKPNEHFIRPFLHKDPVQFKKENELRAVFSKIPIEHPEIPPYLMESNACGELVSVNMDKLMQKIIVHPETGDMFFDLVKLATEEYLSYDFSRRVVRSDLSKVLLS